MTSVFGVASACSRAARFGVSPTTATLLRRALADQIADHDQPGGDADPHLQIRASTPAERPTASITRQPGADRPLGIILVGLRVAEIDQHPVAHVLGDKAVEAADVSATAR